MIARQLIVAGLIYLALVLQTTVIGDFPDIAFRPWLPGLILVVCIRFSDDAAGLVWSAILGLGVDCLSTERLGIQLTIAVLIAVGTQQMLTDKPSMGIVTTGFLVFAATLIWRGIACVTQGILVRQPIELFDVTLSACGSGCATAGLAIALMVLGRIVLTGTRSRPTQSPSRNNRWSMFYPARPELRP